MLENCDKNKLMLLRQHMCEMINSRPIIGHLTYSQAVHHSPIQFSKD